MNRKAAVYMRNNLAGYVQETDAGYSFNYDTEYLFMASAKAVSCTLPLSPTEYTSKVLFPFFDGLIPEGWLLDIAQKNWKLNHKDRMGLLLACCKDCIGAVSVLQLK
ncbi:MAG: HipA N-terminal domain-containing protein [Bacteroidia bacterium]